jgi:glycosyltransferase involved in cell wall biosynthesis
MKINILLPSLNMSGGIRVASEYAKYLSAHGDEVRLIVPGDYRYSPREWLRRVFKQGDFSLQKKGDHDYFKGLEIALLQLDACRPIEDKDVPDGDILMATWWETAEWAAAMSDSKGRKTYLIQAHEVFDFVPVKRVKATYKLPMKKIAVSEWLRDIMNTQYGDSDVELVVNAVDHAQFYATPRDKQHAPTVGFMYSEATFKSTPIAIEVLRQLKQAVPSLKVISFGLDPVRQMEFMGADLEFHYRPAQARIKELYARCDGWLMTGHNEGFGLPALEAMACRTPVVATRVGWPYSAVVPGHNGYLADIDDVAGLLQGALTLVGHSPQQWRMLSEAAYATAEPMTWTASCQTLQTVLKRIAESGADRKTLG